MAMTEVTYTATTWVEDLARTMALGWGFSWGIPWGTGAQVEEDSKPDTTWVEE